MSPWSPVINNDVHAVHAYPVFSVARSANSASSCYVIAICSEPKFTKNGLPKSYRYRCVCNPPPPPPLGKKLKLKTKNLNLAWDETISAATPLHCLSMGLLSNCQNLQKVGHDIVIFNGNVLGHAWHTWCKKGTNRKRMSCSSPICHMQIPYIKFL